MAQQTDAQLTTQSNVIASETLPNANTAARNGAMMQNVIDSKINNDQKTTDISVDAKLPTAKTVRDYIAGRTIDGGTIA